MSLYLIDVSSLFFRAYYALPPLKTSKGIPTHAIHGFLSMLIKVLKEKNLNYIACCFDREEPSFRFDIYPEYKGHRDDTPEDLLVQIPYIRNLVQLMGIPCFDKESFEADDVIGSLTCFGKKHDLEVVIVSGDKDFSQLVDPQVSLFDTMKDLQYKEEDIKAKWGVFPNQMVDYLALVGDSSDNIPGVRGIGKKGAQKLLEEFENLDHIYENLNSIQNKNLREKLFNGKDFAYLSKKLITIFCDIDFSLSLNDLKMKAIEKDSLRSLLSDLELHSVLKILKNLGDQKTFSAPLLDETSPIKILSIRSKSLLSDSKSKDLKLSGSGEDSFEASSEVSSKSSSKIGSSKISSKKKINEIKLVTWNLDEVSENVEVYSQVWVLYFESDLYLGLKERLIKVTGEREKLGELLNLKFIFWKGFDLKSMWWDLKLKDPINIGLDLMILAYLLHFDHLKVTFENVCKKYDVFKEEETPSPELFYRAHIKLEKILKRMLEEENSEVLKNVFYDIELPLIPVLYEMERLGVCIDREALEKQSLDLKDEISVIERKIFEQAGTQFNIGSPKQLAHILFEVKGLPRNKKIKTGYSTDSGVLRKLSKYDSICEDILEFRECMKLKSTYVDALLQAQDQKTKRVHTRFHQTTTSTGRLSSTHPNLQNIPIRTKRGQMIRRCFVSEPHHLLISADYNQIELRILAHLTEDPALLRAFEKGEDIHKATAYEIFNLGSISEVTEELRRRAKAINFGIIYGQGAFGLSESLNIGFQEASDIIHRYFNRFRKVREYTLEIVEFAKKNHYVETLLGRRRFIDELQSSNANVRKFGERAAINAPIQGTASDIVKKAMIDLYKELSCSFLLQVHDELLFECLEEDLESVVSDIRKVMENIIQFKVKLEVNFGWGKNWEKAHS